MPVPCPSCQWPTFLEERGPPEDRTILLTGAARIGEKVMQVVAIRMNGISGRAPDYKEDVPRARYEANNLSPILKTILEDFEYQVKEFTELLDGGASEMINLPTGSYLVVILPALQHMGFTSWTATEADQPPGAD